MDEREEKQREETSGKEAEALFWMACCHASVVVSAPCSLYALLNPIMISFILISVDSFLFIAAKSPTEVQRAENGRGHGRW
jgi:hypothetical protein